MFIFTILKNLKTKTVKRKSTFCLIRTDPLRSILLLGETRTYLNIDLSLYKNYRNEFYSDEDVWTYFAKINITKLGENLNKTEKRNLVNILLEKMEFSDFKIRSKSGRYFPIHKCIVGNYYFHSFPFSFIYSGVRFLNHFDKQPAIKFALWSPFIDNIVFLCISCSRCSISRVRQVFIINLIQFLITSIQLLIWWVCLALIIFPNIAHYIYNETFLQLHFWKAIWLKIILVYGIWI